MALMDNKRTTMRFFIFLLTALLFIAGCDIGTPSDSGFNVSDLDIRGMLFVSELHWAGSVDNYGNNSDPDDDFVELYNTHEAPLDISGWSLVITGGVNLTVVFPAGSIVGSGETWTIGRTTNGAFTNFDYVCPDLVLPSSDIVMTVADGAGKVPDSLELRANPHLPAGRSLPLLRASALRLLDGYGVGMNGAQSESWISYSTNEETWSVAQAAIRTNYRDTVLASPGVMDFNSGW